MRIPYWKRESGQTVIEFLLICILPLGVWLLFTSRRPLDRGWTYEALYRTGFLKRIEGIQKNFPLLPLDAIREANGGVAN